MSFDLLLTPNGDLNVNADGTIQTVSDTPKLRQDIIKIVITPLGSNPNQLWYGCLIGDNVIGNSMSDAQRLNIIQANITQSLQRLQALQKVQSTTQQVTLAETIASIGGVNVERDASDMRQLNIVITVFSKALSQLQELFTIISTT